jgi:hypothetical protein
MFSLYACFSSAMKSSKNSTAFFSAFSTISRPNSSLARVASPSAPLAVISSKA